MENNLSQLPCIVLCGGQGTRLKSVIQDIPKPMAPLKTGMPFLHFLLSKFHKQGITDFQLATGYQSAVIETYFKSHRTPFQVTIWNEDEPLGTGGAIRRILTELTAEYVLVVNGDSFFDLNIADFLAGAHRLQKDAVLALKLLTKGDRYGQVLLNDSTICSFEEKRPFERGYINTGIYYLNRLSFLEHTKKGAFSLEKDYFEKHVRSGCFGGIAQEGFFIDIGIPEDYFYAQTQLTHED
jgi:D-glycero-alpha-D-manno-heptose 1-phosphate guanylyltransferase